MSERSAPRFRRVSRRGRIAGWAVFGAASLLAGCASRSPSRAAASPSQRADLLPRWQAYRDGVLAHRATERFYDVRASRSVFSQTFVAAVRNDPGRSLLVVVEGPLGVAVARASWDGTRTRVERLDGARVGSMPDEEETLSSFGVPLSARALSLLLVGLPEISPPERVEIGARLPWLAWNDGRVACEFDPATGRPSLAEMREGNRRVRVRFPEWREGIPSRILIEVPRGGSAVLALRTAEGES